MYIVTLPVTVEEAVGCGSLRLLIGNVNPEDCVLSKKSDDDYSLSKNYTSFKIEAGKQYYLL